MANIKVYDLAILKNQREKKKIELFLKSKYDQKEKIYEEIEFERRNKNALDKSVFDSGRITPDLIGMYKTVDYQKETTLLTQIEKIEYEVMLVKKDYIKVKKLIDILTEKKAELIKFGKKREQGKLDSMASESSIARNFSKKR